MRAQLEEDLQKYSNQIESLNKELSILEEKKREIVRVGTRLEGVVAYLRQKLSELEKEKPEAPK